MRSFLSIRLTVMTFWLMAVLSLGSTLPARAQFLPSTNLNGATGLIDMPTGESQPDGYFGLDHGQLAAMGRNTLSFQITPRLSGSFRYMALGNWNRKSCPPDCKGINRFDTYYDRNFDVRFKLLNEGKYLPAVTIGLQDFIGTSLNMAEYIAMTKTFGNRLKVTAGLGFGRMATQGAIGTLVGPRPKVDFGLGGLPNVGQWFRGQAAPFGGIEFKISDKLTLKAEYSSDSYLVESDRREIFTHRSPLNFGIEYQATKALRVGAYSMYGDRIGFNFSVLIDPALRPLGGVRGPGPLPVRPRPPIQESPEVWTTTWLDQPDAKQRLLDAMNATLDKNELEVEQISVTADTAQVRFRNVNYDAASQAVGRIARAMTHAMPASIETFEIVPMVYGMPTAKVVVRRSDVEALEFAPDAGNAVRARISIAEAGRPLADRLTNPELLPKFKWSLVPYVQTMLFHPRVPIQALYGVRLSANLELSRGFLISAAVNDKWGGKVRSRNRNRVDSAIPAVRSDTAVYLDQGDPALTVLNAVWLGKLAPQLYSRVSVGYLELMFGGVAAEVMWKPVNRRWAIGADLNYVAQRNSDGGLGFDTYDYRVATGFVSGYFDLGKGYEVQLDAGRYLAGDVGATFTLMRTFANGWKIGAFATFTNLSAKQFGEGSFDKGLKFEFPLSWFTGQGTRTILPFTLRPLGRDGGARLNLGNRLIRLVPNYGTYEYDRQAGRFWK
jgi:hypothetical protein